MNATDGNPYIGQEITILPRVLFSADRDTEPGAQPWKATCVGWTDTQIIIHELDIDDIRAKYNLPEFRGVERELVTFNSIS